MFEILLILWLVLLVGFVLFCSKLKRNETPRPNRDIAEIIDLHLKK